MTKRFRMRNKKVIKALADNDIKTSRDFFGKSDEELQEIKGIGPKTLENINIAINHEIG